MTDFLIKFFVKDYENIKNPQTRTRYVLLACVAGIITNVLLFVVKFFIGLFINSIAVMADSVNNLTDCSTGLLTFFGFKLSNMPADKEHPFGHGRYEYIFALIMAVIIMFVGLEFLQTSVMKIINPEEIKTNVYLLIILFFTCFVKLWQGFFYKKIGNKIEAKSILINSRDSFNDSVITGVTILSIVIGYFFNISVDGIMGVLVAFLIIYTGYGILKDTISTLLGQSVNEQLSKEIKEKILSYDGVLGVHDLIVHNYGPNRNMASIHVEVPCYMDMNSSHKIIDKIEKDVFQCLKVFLVIHIDPVDNKDERLSIIKEIVRNYLKNVDENIDSHDFRIVEELNKINVLFDISFPHNFDEEKINYVLVDIKDKIKETDEKFVTVINVEKSFEGR